MANMADFMNMGGGAQGQPENPEQPDGPIDADFEVVDEK